MSTNNTDAKSTIVKIGTWLPIFPGFYNTLFDTSDSQGRFESDLMEAGLVDKDWRLDFDNASFNNEVLRKCCEWVEKQIPKESGITNITFQHIVVPKEYNFTNDSGNIEVEIDIEKFSVWFNKYLNGVKGIGDDGVEYWIEDSNMAAWEKHLKRHYQSRSGFSSFYSCDAEDWKDNTNNYRFDLPIDPKQYHLYIKLMNGAHSLGRCLEFYLNNEDDEAYDSMYYFVCERVYADNYIKNYPENVTTEDLDKHNIEGLRF